jgi:hypothetical protein
MVAALFPEAVLNFRPGDRLRRPHQLYAGSRIFIAER